MQRVRSSSALVLALLIAVIVAAAAPAGALAAGTVVTSTVTKTVTTTAADPNTPVLVTAQNVPPKGYRLTAAEVEKIAAATLTIRAELGRHPKAIPYEYTKGPGQWQVSWFSLRAQAGRARAGLHRRRRRRASPRSGRASRSPGRWPAAIRARSGGGSTRGTCGSRCACCSSRRSCRGAAAGCPTAAANAAPGRCCTSTCSRCSACRSRWRSSTTRRSGSRRRRSTRSCCTCSCACCCSGSGAAGREGRCVCSYRSRGWRSG